MIVDVISDLKSLHLNSKKNNFLCCKEKWNVPKICTPAKLSTYILKLGFSVVNISKNFKQTVKNMNKLLRVLILKVFGIKPLN